LLQCRFIRAKFGTARGKFSNLTYVGAKDPIAAEAFELPLLDQTKQIALQFQRTLADLVQEDSAAANSNSPFRC